MPPLNDEDIRAMRLHSVAVLHEAVRDDNAALERLTKSPTYDVWLLYVALARTAAAALRITSDTPLQVLDGMRRGIEESH